MSANVIFQTKRSQSTDAPTVLSNGELAYSYSSNKLFIGQTDTANSAVSVEYIGGKLLVDKVANLESIVSGDTKSYEHIIASNTFTLSTATTNGVLFASANGMVDSVSGNAYQIFQVSSNGQPYFGNLNGGNY
jgi:hypothetical protein